MNTTTNSTAKNSTAKKLVRVLGVSAALLAAGVAHGPAAMAATLPHSAQASTGQVGAPQGYDETLAGAIRNSVPGVVLDQGTFDVSHSIDPASTAPAPTVPSGAWTSFWVGSQWDACAGFTYRIAHTDGTPTGYWIRGDGEVPSVASDHMHFDVYQGDPAHGGRPTAVSPYEADASGMGGDHPSVAYTLVRRAVTVVTDPGRQRQLLDQYVGKNMANASYVASSVSDVTGPQEPLGDKVVNNTDLAEDHTISASHTTTLASSVGGKVSVEAGFGAAVKATAEASWNITASSSWTHTFTDTLHVPAHHTGWFTIGPSYKRVTGDFTIRAGSTYYLLPATTFDFPNPNGGNTLVAHQEPNA